MDLQNKGQDAIQSIDELLEVEDMYTTVLYNDEVCPVYFYSCPTKIGSLTVAVCMLHCRVILGLKEYDNLPLV